jgi:hypothetical protein
MNLPGWNSLDSVRSIDSVVQIVTLCFWSLLVLFEAIAFGWKKRSALFTILALVSFAVAVGGEAVHYKYDHRKEVLYDARENDLKSQHERELQKARDDAQSSAESARAAERETAVAKRESEQGRLLEQQANDQLAALKAKETPRTISEDQRRKILTALKGTKTREIIVLYASDLESQNYADQIIGILKEAGWTVPPPPFRLITHSVPGVVIMVHDVKVPEPEAAQLQFAFKTAGIDINGGTQPQVAAGKLEMWVGPKNAVTVP